MPLVWRRRVRRVVVQAGGTEHPLKVNLDASRFCQTPDEGREQTPRLGRCGCGIIR
jgi:hypothetical protein